MLHIRSLIRRVHSPDSRTNVRSVSAVREETGWRFNLRRPCVRGKSYILPAIPPVSPVFRLMIEPGMNITTISTLGVFSYRHELRNLELDASVLRNSPASEEPTPLSRKVESRSSGSFSEARKQVFDSARHAILHTSQAGCIHIAHLR